MDFKLLIPFLGLCANVPWCAGNPHPLALNGNDSLSINKLSERQPEIQDDRKNLYSKKDVSSNLWRRDGNPGINQIDRRLNNYKKCVHARCNNFYYNL